MIKNVMSLKAKINNIAKEESISPQAVMQIYMLERLLERISISKYKNNFILKGGMLISSILGIESRSTMDMDTTIKKLELNNLNLKKILTEIILLDINDNVIFNIMSIENIRDDDDYGGQRVHLQAFFDEMPVNLKIDVTTGDKITYREINYNYNLLLENRSINIWTYNIETILAEKYETVIKRNILNTRIRDFYDIYMLINLEKNNLTNKELVVAINETAKHRKSYEYISDFLVVNDVISQIENDSDLKKQWKQYQKRYIYAKDISYNDLINAVNKIKDIYFQKDLINT